MRSRSVGTVGLAVLGLAWCVPGLAQTASNNVVYASPPTNIAGEVVKLDYVNAKPISLPIAAKFSTEDVLKAMTSALAPASAGITLSIPGVSVGGTGSGEKSVQNLGAPAQQPSPAGMKTILDFGTANLPFSTARADLDPAQTNEDYPYRAAGKLFFRIGQDSYICSASLIKAGLVVTAAHCVTKFGSKSYYSDWQFVPGYRDGIAPYGLWTAAQAFVLTPYFDGTDTCAQNGVVCRDDIAVLALNPQKDASGKAYYAGSNAGWFSYGWDRTGFAGQKITHVTQIGYPACLDNGGLMERNDAQGSVDSQFSDNTVIGSLMCGGSSGGPWLINFGMQPKLTGTSSGSAPASNQVIGVTSWGSTDNAVKWMGASPFLSSNIVQLVDTACKAYPNACKD